MSPSIMQQIVISTLSTTVNILETFYITVVTFDKQVNQHAYFLMSAFLMKMTETWVVMITGPEREILYHVVLIGREALG